MLRYLHELSQFNVPLCKVGTVIPIFSGEHSEAQRGLLTCPGLHNWKATHLGFGPGWFVSKAHALTIGASVNVSRVCVPIYFLHIASGSYHYI